MEIALILIVVIITLIIILGSIYAVWIGYEQWQYMNDPHKMLFLSSTNREIDQKLDQIIAKYLQETKDYNLVELGCGKAVVLKSLAQKHQWKSVTGIEGQKSVWLQAWINCNILPKFKFKNSPLEKTGTAGLDPATHSPKGWQAKPDGVDKLIGSYNLNQKIQLLNQNIFDYVIKKPTFHYCYLGAKLMSELYLKKKFKNSIVVSLDYTIEGIIPTEIIQLTGQSKIQKTMFVYKF